ncbi:Signal transduction response regulator / Disease resistance domain-containing protein [Alloactinosynnema sp. L-07]|uniref:ATP-binding protein n=1 Tax=Alloactinosynnema sp. L-07 TaxID=1653480 RepID=UPI00065EFF69|nr:LuxR C-terminal-related transcriptional regulator [Alloactinosynnema sp. L-07]CRK59203.1 Signal transduction response regulator / Disease resistance domain-containing protein [Alloactinosynnema sp. L-07]
MISDDGPLSTVHPGSPGDLTTFVGRADLLAEATELLLGPGRRLVTLVGTGGVGKTRLARELAARVVDTFAHGAVLVDLTDVRAADDRVDAAVIEAVGLLDNATSPARARLIEHLRDRSVLLVLDNCEQLVSLDGEGELPRLVSTLLATAPGVRILATSRVALGVSGERRVRIPPMWVSAGGDPDGAVTEALALLLDRADAYDVTIAQSDYPLANELCRMLDGLPLAIELAAGRLDVLTLDEIVDRCEDSMRLLVRSGRAEQRHHQTLHATLRWSFDLLLESDQRMWVMMSVFDGGFDLAAAEGVCAAHGVDSGEVLDLLTRLVHASLLTTQARRGRTYYRMLEVVRRFGHEIADPDELNRIRDSHAAYYGRLVDRAAREWYGPDESEWIDRLRRNLHNIRAAVDHLVGQGDWMAALSIACDVTRTRTHICVGQINEARRLLRAGLNAHPEEPSELEVTAVSMLAYLAMLQGSREEADPLLDRAERVATAIGAHASPALLFARGMRDWLVGQSNEEAAKALTTLTAAIDTLGDTEPSERMAMLIVLAIAASVDGTEPAARETAEAFWAEVAESGVDSVVSWALFAKSIVALRFGTLAQALDLVQRCLRLQYPSEDTWGPAWCLWLRAVIAARMADHVVSARLFGAAHARHRATDVSMSGLKPWWRLQVDAERNVRRALGEDYDVEVAVGAALPYDEAMVLALAVPTENGDGAGAGAHGLTQRQLQIARLVADGLTNKEIAAKLTLSTRTVENHVLRTIGRLGLDGKGKPGLAAWYAENIHAGSPAATPTGSLAPRSG